MHILMKSKETERKAGKDKDNAFMSKELATIYTNVKLPFEIDQVSFEGYKESVNVFIKRLNDAR